jgi:hypothetical protein
MTIGRPTRAASSVAVPLAISATSLAATASAAWPNISVNGSSSALSFQSAVSN